MRIFLLPQAILPRTKVFLKKFEKENWESLLHLRYMYITVLRS